MPDSFYNNFVEFYDLKNLVDKEGLLDHTCAMGTKFWILITGTRFSAYVFGIINSTLGHLHCKRERLRRINKL